MKILRLNLILFLLLSFFYNGYSQEYHLKDKAVKKNYIGLYLGTQMSGIRKEDYILKNLVPYIQVEIGRRFSSVISAELFYQGASFKYISDNYTHKYLYLGSNGLINLRPLLLKNRMEDWKFNIILGLGFFENYFYNRSQLAFNVGFSIEKNLDSKNSINLKLGRIVSRKIYQPDLDALQTASIGYTRYF